MPSICEPFSAFCASSFQHISAVGGSHSFSETMFLFALAFLRLIRSNHFTHLLQLQNTQRYFLLLHKTRSLSRAFCFFSHCIPYFFVFIGEIYENILALYIYICYNILYIFCDLLYIIYFIYFFEGKFLCSF